LKQGKYFGEIFKDLKALSAVNPEIVVKKSLAVVVKLNFVQWDIFEPPGRLAETHSFSASTELEPELALNNIKRNQLLIICGISLKNVFM